MRMSDATTEETINEALDILARVKADHVEMYAYWQRMAAKPWYTAEKRAVYARNARSTETMIIKKDRQMATLYERLGNIQAPALGMRFNSQGK